MNQSLRIMPTYVEGSIGSLLQEEVARTIHGYPQHIQAARDAADLIRGANPAPWKFSQRSGLSILLLDIVATYAEGQNQRVVNHAAALPGAVLLRAFTEPWQLDEVYGKYVDAALLCVCDACCSRRCWLVWLWRRDSFAGEPRAACLLATFGCFCIYLFS